MTLDLRVFREELTRLITGEFYQLPGSDTFNAVAYDLRNNAQATQQGSEYQLSWRPWSGATLAWGAYRANTVSDKVAVQRSVPAESQSLVWLQQIDPSLSLFSAYVRTQPMTWLGEATAADTQKILMLSLQKTVKLEQARVRTSLTLRQPAGQFVEYRELQSLARTVWLGVQIER